MNDNKEMPQDRPERRKLTGVKVDLEEVLDRIRSRIMVVTAPEYDALVAAGYGELAATLTLYSPPSAEVDMDRSEWDSPNFSGRQSS